jgi:hypothetical protein
LSLLKELWRYGLRFNLDGGSGVVDTGKSVDLGGGCSDCGGDQVELGTDYGDGGGLLEERRRWREGCEGGI